MVVSLTPFSLIDFPKKLSAILWFGGCNLRCAYCYNYELIYPQKFLPKERIIKFLESRIGLLDGVVCSGGECSIWGDKLIGFIQEIKSMGFCIKVDTNASNPKVLQELLEKKLLEYVALDFKAPAYKMQKLCLKEYYKDFKACFELLRDSHIEYEVRSTFHSDFLTKEDLIFMRDWLRENGYRGEYFVQGFVGDKGSLGNVGLSNNEEIKNLEGIVYRGK
ncbi:MULTISPECIES: anaerobic ribonucleoside-triphosphate reductase activating protein [unclassified Helicobacter]|uniref:anaerobic ribonucleoside-triphosphate reductase activating protein n=1 Tax=unclassified Helicobacter TaxID=2593540 RepID=UPI00131533DC|nr:MULTISPECIES: anaerobic ribonucleoside-triphosphate reductase activating protein [unclassified Helicobacter]